MRDLLSKERSCCGYNLLELLVSLLVTMIIISLCYPLLKNLKELVELEKYRYQDEIGIYQLQIQLALNKVISFESDEIIYQTSENECVIELVNDNLISTPGFLCYLYHIDDMDFYQEKEILFIEYNRDGEWYEYPICYLPEK